MLKRKVSLVVKFYANNYESEGLKYNNAPCGGLRPPHGAVENFFVSPTLKYVPLLNPTTERPDFS